MLALVWLRCYTYYRQAMCVTIFTMQKNIRRLETKAPHPPPLPPPQPPQPTPFRAWKSLLATSPKAFWTLISRLKHGIP